MGSNPSSFYEQSKVQIIRKKRTKPVNGDGNCLVEAHTDNNSAQQNNMSDINTASRLPPIVKPKEPNREAETRLLNDVSETDMTSPNDGKYEFIKLTGCSCNTDVQLNINV
jgi:hypothetical protein